MEDGRRGAVPNPAGSRPREAPAEEVVGGVFTRDLAAGLVFVAIGVAGLWVGRGLNVGTADAMAEGYFPRAMCLLLVTLGGAIAVVALRRPGAGLEPLRLRPLTAVTLSVVVFAAGLERLGLAATLLLAVAIANLAARPLRVIPLFVLVAVLFLGIAAIFVWGLGLPLRLLPRLG